MTKKKLDVLILDDEPVVGDRLRPVIEEEGHNAEVFVNSLKALRRINEKDFDIIVTDIRMENASGIEVLERAVAKNKRTKVIMITGYATMQLAREAMGKMAFYFVAKPFKLNEIREIVRKAAQAIENEE
jgi:DNA-binding NtrC family response regulator